MYGGEYRNEGPASSLEEASSHHSSFAWSIVESQRALNMSPITLYLCMYVYVVKEEGNDGEK